jgi:predicted NACHT family NTPase
MAPRSLKASSVGIEQARLALTSLAISQEKFAEHADVSRSTAMNFFSGKPVDRQLFVQICNSLSLNWQEIAELSESLRPEARQKQINGIANLVQQLRHQIQPYIQEKCGTMRVLDMTQPIELGEIYTSVNILEKITSRSYRELSELLQDRNPEQFERFCLGNIREKRVPGLEAVEKFPKLMILGKPGAGKTTFLKHLAMQCIRGQFQADCIPIFITLKEFAETDDQPDLLSYINQLPNVEANKHSSITEVVRAGKALILLDGLDEVRGIDNSRILKQITTFSQKFPNSQFVITCRIAAREYTFENFVEVEVADFDAQQVTDFSNQWFHCKNDLVKAERFLQKLKDDEPLRELASNPLLLTLLCLVFEDAGNFPANRAELYENGVDVLLKKWDVKRNIERDQVYKGLSLKRKEDLLSEIANATFTAGNYFFKQREVESFINQYIQNLPHANTNLEVLALDSTAVLKSIEAQHGLLVERARNIYSFSHLTFHEYFTARKLALSANPKSTADETLQALANRVSDKREYVRPCRFTIKADKT